MPAPFAGSELDTFQAMHSGLHQEQIQNAYALTPQMNPNLYGHATPNVVYEDHNAMVMMVEELDIEEPAQPIKFDGTGSVSFDRSTFDPFDGYSNIQYGQYHDEALPKHHHSRIPRHRAEAIRESDIPPRFRKRKAPRDRSTSFHSRRAKVHPMPHSAHCNGHGNGHHGPWYKDPVSKRTSIRELVMRYSNHQ